MCQKTKCRACGKYTWTGCGNHIESVLRGVRPEDRCRCGGRGGNKCVGSQCPVRQPVGTQVRPQRGRR